MRTLKFLRMQAVSGAPQLGGNGVFSAISLPAGGSAVVILPRWNIIALAKRPVAVSVRDVSLVPEICPPHLSVRFSPGDHVVMSHADLQCTDGLLVHV